MRNKIKKIYGSKYELYELPFHKQMEIFENVNNDLEAIKDILMAVSSNPSLRKRVKDFDKLIACMNFTIHQNYCLLLYYKKLQEDGKHSSLEGRYYGEQSKALN